MVSFCVRKASTLACSRCEAAVSFSSSACRFWYCGLQVADLGRQRGLAGQRLAGQVFPPGTQRRPGLAVQLVLLLLQGVHLELDPLARCGHIGDAPADLRQHLQLALVGVVQGLARIFQPVQLLISLGLEDQ